MSLLRALEPLICKVHEIAVAGGSDVALCIDLTIMADRAQIGYMPAHVWATSTTAIWGYRLTAEKAKRMLFTVDEIHGHEV